MKTLGPIVSTSSLALTLAAVRRLFNDGPPQRLHVGVIARRTGRLVTSVSDAVKTLRATGELMRLGRGYYTSAQRPAPRLAFERTPGQWVRAIDARTDTAIATMARKLREGRLVPLEPADPWETAAMRDKLRVLMGGLRFTSFRARPSPGRMHAPPVHALGASPLA